MRSLTLIALLLSLSLALVPGCGSKHAAPSAAQEAAQLDSAAPVQTTTASSARMYLPVCRDENYAAAHEASQAKPPELDGEALTIWRELSAALQAALAEQANAEGAGDALKSASTRPTGEDNVVPVSATDDGAGGMLIEWAYINCGDYDFNGEVNSGDLVPLAQHFGAHEGDAGWETAALADGDGNGELNQGDIVPIAQHYGASCAGYTVYGRDAGDPGYTQLGQVDYTPGEGEVPAQFSYQTAQVMDEYLVAAFDFDGDDRPVTPVVRPEVEVIDTASLTVAQRDDTSLTFSGDVSGIEAGSVLVSGEGEGFLLRAESVTPVSGGAVVEYSQATLEDLFDYADLELERTLSFNSLESFVPALDGVTVEASSMGASAADKTGSANIAAIKIKMPQRDFYAGTKLQLEFDFNLDVNVKLQVGEDWTNFGALESFYFETKASAQGTAVVAWKASTSLIDQSSLIGSFCFAPIVLLAGPVPVVFTPQLDLYAGFKGEVEIGLEFKPSVTVTAKGGVTYTRGYGWDTISDLKLTGSPGFTKPNLYGKAVGTLNLFSPEPTLELYGVAGPYARFYSPAVKATAQLQTTPPEFSLTGELGARGIAGAKVSVLGKTLAECEPRDLFEVYYKLYSRRWPLADTPDPPSSLVFDLEYDTPNVVVGGERPDNIHKPSITLHNDGYYAGPDDYDPWLTSYATQLNPGRLSDWPYALWEDLTVYNSEGFANSGIIRCSVNTALIPEGRTECKIIYYNPGVGGSHIRVNQITVITPSATRVYDMQNGKPAEYYTWVGLKYFTDTDTVEVIDDSHYVGEVHHFN